MKAFLTAQTCTVGITSHIGCEHSSGRPRNMLELPAVDAQMQAFKQTYLDENAAQVKVVVC